MDKQEAKRVLQARRPNDLDAGRPAFAEALALAEADPELSAWWEAQQAFDRKVAAKLGEVPLPDDLRETILAGRKIEPFAPQPLRSFWLAVAAVVAILCAVGTSFHSEWEDARHVSTDTYDQAVFEFLGNDTPALGMTSPDHDKIVAWLKQQQAPTGDLPAKMATLPSVGCQRFVVQGHLVSLICFTLAEGKLVHLFVINQDALLDPPTRSAPEFREIDGWSTASWSDGRMSYMLVTQAGPNALMQLL
jgi:anti-sigma factor RsiW